MFILPHPGKISADADEWSCFLAFVLSLITSCLFLFVLLLSVAK